MAPAHPSQPTRIGLFDSGVGGLSVLRKLNQLSSGASSLQFVYLGDTARCPYGNRQANEIRQFIRQIVAFLSAQNIEHLVMACNTSAAVGLDQARAVSPIPVHDLITPTAKFVAPRFRRIGVLATQSTVNSGAFSKKILYHAPQCQVFEVACPKLVPLVEAGELAGDQVKAVLMEYLSQLEQLEVEAVILGCTHFPFLSDSIKVLLPPNVALLDPADMLAQQLWHDLGLSSHAQPEDFSHNRAGGDAAAVQFLTTGSASLFSQTAAICLAHDRQLSEALKNTQLLPLETLCSSDAQSAELASECLPSNVVPMPTAKPAVDTKMIAP